MVQMNFPFSIFGDFFLVPAVKFSRVFSHQNSEAFPLSNFTSSPRVIERPRSLASHQRPPSPKAWWGECSGSGAMFSKALGFVERL